jgi:hypothetical protein
MRFAVFALGAVAGSLAACAYHHEARLTSRELPPPPVEMVPHTGKLFVQLTGETGDRQCQATPGKRNLCFARIGETLGSALRRTLWPSFPEVVVEQKGDTVGVGDYILMVRLELEALPADEAGPGWSAGAKGSWQLVRDGIPLAGESVSSRSRAEFPYGASLGDGASDAVDAIAVHIATVVGQLPETRPVPGVPLPAVATGTRVGPLFGGVALSCQSSDDANRCSMASR